MKDNIVETRYEEKLINEIIEMMKTNLLIYYNFDDNSCINLRNHCKDKYDTEYKSVSYQELLFFVEEALADLINCPFLYDFRPLE